MFHLECYISVIFQSTTRFYIRNLSLACVLPSFVYLLRGSYVNYVSSRTIIKYFCKSSSRSPQCASIESVHMYMYVCICTLLLPFFLSLRRSRTLIYFGINLFLFYLPTKIPAVAGCAAAALRRVATSTVNRKPCGIAAILSRMRVSTCTRRSYARRSKYGNAFTRNVFTGLSRNTRSTREATLTVYKQP